jgi:hypothetical protein
MKLSFAIAMVGVLWATVAQPQALTSSGPGSSVPVGPDDRPLVTKPTPHLLSVSGRMAGMPGPYLPHPNDRVGSLPAFRGFASLPE